ncbi:MAG: hypothetical protein OEZ33_10070 [Gammaproteobacteria bacterium]|nr:hypothetical protein [Gammaproteobacteria bacterium]MDH5778548.1 hypothetical protein [Gammaproteobacteria bacterium]
MSDKFRQKRIEIYCKEVTKGKKCPGQSAKDSHCGWYAIRKQLDILDLCEVPSQAKRRENFKQLVKDNFTSGDWFDAFKESDPRNNQVFHGTSFPWLPGKETTKAFKNLKLYAESDFGAMLVQKILLDNKKPMRGKRFFIGQDNNGSASGSMDRILFPKDFPSREKFFTRDVIYPMAIIHHEMGHTKFFSHVNKKLKGEMDVCHERLVVINNENPVKMFYGHEPRYTYYRPDSCKTVNVITGESLPGLYTFDLKDPRKMVKLDASVMPEGFRTECKVAS